MQKYIYLALAVFMLSSCENTLDIDAKSQLTYEEFWGDESGAQAAQSGLYGSLRDQTFNIWRLGTMRSDVWGGTTFESEVDRDLIRSNINVSNVPFGDWGGFYGRIHQVNDFIENIPEVEFNDESEKAHFLGQAYGLRAFYYYSMLRTWGEVPIVDETFVRSGEFDGTSAEGLSKERAPQEEVMDFIKQDIERSLETFDEDDSFWNGNKNYWSKAATLALKGDVYIWSGNILEGGDEDFETAKLALQEVADYGIELLDNYNDLWGADNENNNEFIFAVQYEEDEEENFFNSFTGRSTEIHQTYNAEGESLSDFVISGSNRYGPSNKTLELIDDNADSRKKATFMSLYKDSNNGNGYPSFDADHYFGSVVQKFLGQLDGNERIFDSDLPIYRYADVVLLLAEAKNLLTEDPSDEINMIRERAYGSDFDSSLSYTNQSPEENAKAILEERYKEFIAEGKRWWDLRRAGDQFVIDNIEFLDAGDEYKLLLPITSDMLSRNPKLEQTPGYED